MNQERIEILVDIAARAKNVAAYEPEIVSRLKNSLNEKDLVDFHYYLSQELPFLNNMTQLSESETLKVYGLFNWLSAQLISKSLQSSVPVVLVLHVSAALDYGNGQLWSELHSIGTLREDRLSELSELLLTRKCEFERFPNSESHLMKAFQECCYQFDLKGIDDLLRHVIGYLYNVPLSRAARAMSIFSSKTLEHILDKITDLASLITIIDSLEQLNSFQIDQVAITSSNWALKFCALRLPFEYGKNPSKQKYESSWAKLLIQASQNAEEWPKWALVFNKYPSRYPELQGAMAIALCEMSQDAIVQYFKVLVMHSNRRTDLLEVFNFVQLQCSKVQRERIWKIAFDRWRTWGFEERHIFSLQSSPLDYAVAAYFRECLTGEERNQQELKFRADYISAQNNWYEGVGEYVTALNRHLSLYQPLAHAQSNRENESDWLAAEYWYYPDWAPNNSYWQHRKRELF